MLPPFFKKAIMHNYVQKGEVIDWLNNTGGAIASGQPVFIGALTGVAQGIIADGKIGEIRILGVCDFEKTTNLTIAVGDKVFWNTTTKKITKTATDEPIGVCTLAATLNATKCRVMLNVGGAVGALIVPFTDSTGGTPGTTLASISAGGSYAQADMVAVKNAIASIAAMLRNAGLVQGS